MGEIAEAMLDGFLCASCGSFLDGESPGFARFCGDCDPRPLEPPQPPGFASAALQAAAEAGFEDARRVAAAAGLRLRRCTAGHYQLRGDAAGGEWILDLYPGNRRIYRGKHRGRPRAPLIPLHGWTLLTAVQAYADREKGARRG